MRENLTQRKEFWELGSSADEYFRLIDGAAQFDVILTGPALNRSKDFPNGYSAVIREMRSGNVFIAWHVVKAFVSKSNCHSEPRPIL
jgi:hypothetical protein